MKSGQSLEQEVKECLALLRNANTDYLSGRLHKATCYRKAAAYSTAYGTLILISTIMWIMYDAKLKKLDVINRERWHLDSSYLNKYCKPNSDAWCSDFNSCQSPTCDGHDYTKTSYCKSIVDEFCPQLNTLNTAYATVDKEATTDLVLGLVTAFIFLLTLYCLKRITKSTVTTREDNIADDIEKNSIRTLSDYVNLGYLSKEEKQRLAALSARMNIQSKLVSTYINKLEIAEREITMKNKQRYAFLSGTIYSNKGSALHTFFESAGNAGKELTKQIFSHANLEATFKFK